MAVTPRPVPHDLAHTEGALNSAIAWAENPCECEFPEEGELGTIICCRCSCRAVFAELKQSREREARLAAALEDTADGLAVVSGSRALTPKMRKAFAGTVAAIRAALAENAREVA